MVREDKTKGKNVKQGETLGKKATVQRETC